MLNTMDKLICLIVCWAAFVCICGGGEDSSSKCETIFTVRRHSAQKMIPGQHLTVSCPVKHCGKSLNVTWYKFSTTWEQMLITDKMEINQIWGEDEMISFLNFKHVSIDDIGLYRCYLMGNKPEVFSHSINISVSDPNQRVENDENKAAVSQSGGGDDKSDSWLPYFIICIAIMLLVASLTAVTFLCFFDRKLIWPSNYAKQETISTHMIPNTPKTSASTSPVLQNSLSVLNEICSSGSAETSSLPPLPTENQPPVTNTTAKSEASKSEVYADINHKHSNISTTKQPAICKKDDDAKYAIIKMP